MNEALESILVTEDTNLKNLNFIGLTSCPMKQIFRENLEDTLQKYKKDTDKTLKCYTPTGCHSKELVEEVLLTPNFEEFPDVFTCLGFKNMFRSNIIDNFAAKGLFKSTQSSNINKSLEDLGLIDPEGVFSMYSISAEVILVDKNKLGNLPIPKTWGDLLNPIYKGKLIIGGCDGDIHEDQLLYYYKEFGHDGINALAENSKNTWHPAEMAKSAAMSSSHGAALYIIPWFFANACPSKPHLQIVCPEDGAMVGPSCIVAKESKIKEVGILVDSLLNSEFGTKCADNLYPSLNPDVDNNIPEGFKFKWLGWDFIRSHNMEETTKKITDEFIETFNSTESDIVIER
ncbi:ABC transporter substrate-binding protein [Clostridium sp. LBM24168]